MTTQGIRLRHPVRLHGDTPQAKILTEKGVTAPNIEQKTANDNEIIERFLYRKLISGRDVGGFVSQSTVNLYRAAITKFTKWREINDLTLDDITREHWDEYNYYLAQIGHTSGGVRHQLQHLKSFFNYLTSDEYGPPYLNKRNPFANVKKPPQTQQPEERFIYSEEAFTALLINQPLDWMGVRNKAMFWVARCTGLRKTELRTMLINNLYITPERSTISVEGKFGKWRDVVIENAAIPALMQYLEIRARKAPSHDFLWIQKDKKPLSTDAIKNLAYRNMHIVRQFHKGRHNQIDFFHAFRRTFALNCIELNIPTRAIQFQFGWSSPNMIDHYTASLDSRYGQHHFSNMFETTDAENK